MSKPNVTQKRIFELLSDRKSDFLIPDYQRPYAWTEDQCQTLWDDVFSFAIPNNDHSKFIHDDEYFLGSVISFPENGKFEVIDGQQRLTTLMLLLRAFYDKFEHLQDEESRLIRKKIELCLWKTDEFGRVNKDMLKITSEVATDNDKDEFLQILKTGKVPKEFKSQYAQNFNFFLEKIRETSEKYFSTIYYVPARILENCAVLFVEAENQDGALRIFSTLNDRGLPLADADIFKSQFYKFYRDSDQKDNLITQWKNLEEITAKIFSPSQGTPMDELFTKYMYFLRAKEGNENSTTESLRNFFRKNNFKYLKNNSAMDDLTDLATFWEKINLQDSAYFSDSVLKKLFVLRYSPNVMWENITSAYFLHNRDENDNIDMEDFDKFLNTLTLFTFTYAVVNPGMSQLRIPAFKEMASIAKNQPASFEKYMFSEDEVRVKFENHNFTNMKTVTKSILAWYAFQNPNQNLLKLNEPLQIEHIFAKKRAELEGTQNPQLIESLGNKILLESSINIKASDYRFEDKKLFYLGEKRRGSDKTPSRIAEAIELTKATDFTEESILLRNKLIIESLISQLKSANLVK